MILNTIAPVTGGCFRLLQVLHLNEQQSRLPVILNYRAILCIDRNDLIVQSAFKKAYASFWHIEVHFGCEDCGLSGKM